MLPAAITDDALVEALRADVPGAPDLLFERYGPYVERLIVRVVGLDPDLPDLIHEVFLRALERLESLKRGAALKGWIGSIAIFTTRTHLRDRGARRRRMHLYEPDALPDPEAPRVDLEVSEALRRTYVVLDSLPIDERVPFSLRFVDGMELAEIGVVCGLSLATVKRRIARAQRRFETAARRDPLLRELAEEFAREGEA
jgi:RNA polymerase sigma-70 factor (ECF subfamily)